MLTSRQLMAATGVTYRQVSYWATCRYLISTDPAPGSGHSHEFDEREIPVAFCLAALSRADMLGCSSGAGRSRQAQYLPALLAHVRAHGLTGHFPLDCDYISIDLERVAYLAMA